MSVKTAKPTIASLTATIAQLEGVIKNQAASLKNNENTMKMQYEEKKALLAKEIELRAQIERMNKEIGDMHNPNKGKVNNNNLNIQTITKLSEAQMKWLDMNGCILSKTNSGYKLFLRGECLNCPERINKVLGGKVQRDNNSTWIYFV